MGKKKKRKAELPVKKPQPVNVKFIWYSLGLIFLLTFIAYFNSFTNDFVFDDRTTIIDEASVRRIQDLLPLVGTPYRPLVRLSFALNYALGGINTFGYHIVNFLFHLGVGFLLFFIFRRLLGQVYPNGESPGSLIRYLPLAGALLFVLHPVNTESVTYISSRSSLICAFFFLLAFYLYLIEIHWGWVILAFMLSLGGKELSAVFPLVLLIYDTAFKKKNLKESFISNLWFFALLGFLLIYKIRFGGLESLYTDGAIQLRSVQEHIITQLSVVATYFRLLFLPVNLTLDYDYHWSLVKSLAGGLILIFISFAVFYFRKRFPILSLAAGFTLLNLLAVIAPILFDNLFEHHLYLVLPGFLLFILGLAAYLFNLLPQEKLKLAKPAMAILLILITAAMTYGCWRRNLDWKDELTVWADSTRKAPLKPRPHGNYGNALKERNLPEQAEQEYLTALKLKPDYIDVMTSLGALYLDQNRLAEGEKWLLKANEMRSGHYLILYNLGLLYGKMNDFKKSEYYYKESIKFNPNYALTWNNLGNIYGRNGDLKGAEDCYKRAIAERYYMGEAHNNLGSLYANRGEYQEAIGEFEKAVNSKPPYRQALFNLARIYQLQGDKTTALNYYNQFLQYFPNHPMTEQVKAAIKELQGK